MSVKAELTEVLKDVQIVQEILAKHYSDETASRLNLNCEGVPSLLSTSSLILDQAEKELMTKLNSLNVFKDYSGQ